MARSSNLRGNLVRWAVSCSLTLAPFYGLPSPAQQAPAESEASQSARLLLDMEKLLDRALYPEVPRQTRMGTPTTSEMTQVQTRLAALKQSYQSQLEGTIAGITDEQMEAQQVIELNNYFTAAQRLEGLKIVLGQPVETEKWDELYTLKISLESLSQLKFIANAGAYSDSFVALPGSALDLDLVAKQRTDMMGFTTRLDNVNGQWILTLKLNPAFAETFERLAMTTNLSTRNVLLYSVHWTAHRLYDSLAFTHILLRQPLASLPEPSALMKQQFASMRVQRQLILNQAQMPVVKEQKLQILKAILDAMDAAYAKKRGWMIDESFMKSFGQLAGIPGTNLAANIEGARSDEHGAFQLALVSLLNLMEIKDWVGQSTYLIYEAKRLAMRSAFLINPDPHFNMTPEARQKMAQLIDTKAKAIATEISAGGLSQTVTQLAANFDVNKIWNAQRIAFQEGTLSAAKKMQTFANDSVNLSYLISAQRGAIDLLHPSGFVNSLVDAIENQNSYSGGYQAYKNQFYTYLQAFSVAPDDLAPLVSGPQAAAAASAPANLTTAFAQASHATWNPQRLSGHMDPKYIAALSLEAKARTKDLTDLVRVGQLLKFDVYEKSLNEPRGKRHGIIPTATPNSLGLTENWFSRFIGSERQAYLEAMKKDLFNSAPILGGTVDPSSGASGMVWEALNRSDLDATAKYKVVDTQLAKVWRQIGQNAASVDTQLSSINATKDDSLSGANNELRALMTLASQISVSLNSYAGFNSYYGEIRNELLLPGFWGNQWQEFSSWSNRASNYMILFFALQLAGSKIVGLGRGVDFIAKLLSPVFGLNMARLNYFLAATFGITISQSAIETYQENEREKTMRRFFECASASPCVSLYADVALQTQLADAKRNNLIITGATMIALLVGIKYLGTAVSAFSARAQSQRYSLLLPHLKRLGLDGEGSVLSSANVDRAAKMQLALAKAQPDKFLRAANEAAIMLARRQVELSALKEAGYWMKQNERFADAASQLGLDSRTSDWKRMSDLANAWGQLEARYKAGQISTFHYEQLMQSIVNMHQTLNPVYAQMKNPFMRSFMDRVWDSSTGASQAELSATESYYKSLDVSATFKEAMQSYVSGGIKSTVAEDAEANQLINNTAAEIEKDPEQAVAKLENLIGRLQSRREK